MTDNRLAGADFVRAAACLLVVAHHIAQRVSPRALGEQAEIAGFFMMGAIGVSAFFVLSGYLLSRPFWVAMDAGQPMPSLRTYALRRSARILPGFWLALTVAFVLSFTLLGFPFDGTLLVRYLSGVFGVSSFSWFTWFPTEFNLPLWSISCEIVSYTLMALCLWGMFKLPFARGWTARVIWVAMIAAVIGVQFLMLTYAMPDGAQRGWEFGTIGGAKIWWPNYNPVAFYAMFTIGVLAAGVQVRLAQLRSIVFDIAALAGLGLAVYMMFAYFPQPDAFGIANIPYAFPWFPLAICLILVATPSSVLVRRVTETAPIAYVARVSFGIYVWHYFLMEIVRVLWQPDYLYWGMRDVGLWAWISVGIVVASFVVATISYYLLEEPVIRWARTLERRPAPGAPTFSPAAG